MLRVGGCSRKGDIWTMVVVDIVESVIVVAVVIVESPLMWLRHAVVKPCDCFFEEDGLRGGCHRVS